MQKVKKIFEDYFKEWIYLYPLEASYLGFNILEEIEEIPVPISEEFREKEKSIYKKYYEISKKLENTSDEKQKIYMDAFKFTLEISLKELEFPDHLLPINHFYSFHLLFPSICSGLNQSFKEKRDLEIFYKKIHFFQRWAKEVISNLEKGMSLKINLPLPVVEKIISQMEFFLKKNKNQNPCFKPIFIMEKEYRGKEKRKEIERVEKEIREKVLVSYEEISSFLKEKYINKCKNETGFFNLPDGVLWYKAKILKYTTLKLEPEEIYQEGIEELKELKEKNKILKAEEFNLKEPLDFLRKYSKNLKLKLAKYFYKIPKRDFKIIPAEKFKERSAPLGEYFLGGIDEREKPIFYLNLKLAKNKPLGEILAIFFHEIMPGHHLQLSLQRENKKLPSFLRYHFFDSFVEGWALYSENLAWEIGLVKEESYKKAVLKNQIWRTLRLILDTGIHLGKIKKEKAMEILMKEGKFTKKHSEIEVLRYAVLPGQALTYKVGEKFFLKLKEEAQNKFREKFNIKDFHNVLLEDGSLPLPILEKKFKMWIKNI
ncbi:MAG: DUF885 domain-containing protein [Thermoanaerobaculia bacterium]